MQAQIREALITLVNAPFAAAYPDIPLVVDNQAFDRNSPPSMWVEYEIKWAGGQQVGMSADPKTRTHGWLYVTVWAREGTGSKASLSVIDWFNSRLKYAAIAGAQLQAPQPESVTPRIGWYIEQLKLYFFTDPQ